MANTYGPDGDSPIDFDLGGALFALRNGNYVKLTTRLLNERNVKSLSIDFTSDAAYENIGIVYNRIGDTDYEVGQLGFHPPRDPLQRTIRINADGWNQHTNPGGQNNSDVYFAFAAWHRVNAGNNNSPWIQNTIKSVNGHNGELRINSANMPDTNTFSFEDLTGAGEASDDDFNDMLITVTFNY